MSSGIGAWPDLLRRSPGSFPVSSRIKTPGWPLRSSITTTGESRNSPIRESLKRDGVAIAKQKVCHQSKKKGRLWRGPIGRPLSAEIAAGAPGTVWRAFRTRTKACRSSPVMSCRQHAPHFIVSAGTGCFLKVSDDLLATIQDDVISCCRFGRLRCDRDTARKARSDSRRRVYLHCAQRKLFYQADDRGRRW